MSLDAPPFIRTHSPSHLSKESYRAQDDPLVLVRVAILGLLMPSGDPRKDREVVSGASHDGRRGLQRKSRDIPPKEMWRRFGEDERRAGSRARGLSSAPPSTAEAPKLKAATAVARLP